MGLFASNNNRTQDEPLTFQAQLKSFITCPVAEEVMSIPMVVKKTDYRHIFPGMNYEKKTLLALHCVEGQQFYPNLKLKRLIPHLINFSEAMDRKDSMNGAEYFKEIQAILNEEDSISFEPIKEPAVTKMGHTYEKKPLIESLGKNKNDPNTGIKIKESEWIDDKTQQQIITMFNGKKFEDIYQSEKENLIEPISNLKI